MLLYSFYTVRPQLFTYLFFAVLLLLTCAADRGRNRWLLAAPPVFALWANFHGGFLAGMAVFLVWSCLHLAVRVWRARRVGALVSPEAGLVLLAMILSALATLLNPDGPGLLVFLLRTATVPRPEIPEWQPLPLTNRLGIAYLLLLAAAIVGWVYSRRERSLPLLIVFACVAVQPLLAVRHISLFVVAAIVLTATHWGDVWNRWFPNKTSAAPAGTPGCWPAPPSAPSPSSPWAPPT
jgi:hypothetical protein